MEDRGRKRFEDRGSRIEDSKQAFFQSSIFYPLSSFLPFVVLLLCLPVSSAAQSGTVGGTFVQTGLAVLPGVGLEVGYVGPKTIFTVEGLLYIESTPPFLGGPGDAKFTLGLGGAIRPLGVIRTIGETDYAYDVDIGIRFGPSLFFANNATRADKNQQFSLFVEPFARFATRLGNGRIVFAEAGSQRPFLRLGIWLEL